MITDNKLHYLIRNFTSLILAPNISIIYPLQIIQGTSNMCLLNKKNLNNKLLNNKLSQIFASWFNEIDDS